MSADAQTCANAMSRSGAKVNATQLKNNEKCLGDYRRGKLSTSFEVCLDADRNGKVGRAAQKTVSTQARKCSPLSAPPAFAYSDAASVNPAATAAAQALTRRIFGDPVDDASLFSVATDNHAAKCQSEMLKRANKLETTTVKEVNKTKKSSLRDAVAVSAAALESTLATVFAANAKITKAEAKLRRGVEQRCSALGSTPPDLVFPGACAAATLLAIEECAIAAARCQACLKTSAFDASDLDCDQADDHSANASCP